MKQIFERVSLSVGLSLLACGLLAGPAWAVGFSVRCNDGDGFGWAVATGGDFNGDGFDDVIVGAPCTPRRSGERIKLNAGMVKVFSGKNGRRLFLLKGNEPQLYLGHGVAFAGDLNGDGKDEIVVGSPGYDLKPKQNPDPFAGTIIDAGRVEVFTSARRKRFRILGTQPEGGFGSSVASIGDMNGDGVADLVISASNERADKAVRPGRVHLYSGRNAAPLGVAAGLRGGEEFGAAIAAVPDVDGDGVDDVVIGVPNRNENGVTGTGLTVVMHGDLGGAPILEQGGARRDNLGKSVDQAGDRDGDGRSEIVVGAYNADGTGLKGAGEIRVYDGDGTLMMAAVDSQPQENAHFGASVADLGDITGDAVDDFAVGAPDFDLAQTEELSAQPEAGRTVAIDGMTGSLVWAQNGEDSAERMGFSVAGGLDYDRDGTPDVITGALGAHWKLRRGAGKVSILSGTTGEELRAFGGGHGRETRVFIAGDSELIGYSPDGMPRTPRASLKKIRGNLSVAVLNDSGLVLPGQVLVAVGAGHKGNNGNVTIYDGGRKDRLIDEFDALSGTEPVGVPGTGVGGGVNVAAGKFSLADDDEERIVAVQADSSNGDVLVRVFRHFDEQEGWFLDSQFLAFQKNELFQVSPTVGFEIKAKGGTVAVGDVDENPGDEIIVGTELGLPVVRVFTVNGELLSEWLAYDPTDSDGVQVCVGDVSPFRAADIITVPSDGVPIIKVFAADGVRMPVPGTDDDISIIPPIPPTNVGGGRACGADVDFDDRPEIIYMPGPGVRPRLQAFELDGTPLVEFAPFDGPGTAFAATDNFVRP